MNSSTKVEPNKELMILGYIFNIIVVCIFAIFILCVMVICINLFVVIYNSCKTICFRTESKIHPGYVI